MKKSKRKRRKVKSKSKSRTTRHEEEAFVEDKMTRTHKSTYPEYE